MFANYLIGLREGLEAALVVTILIAYVVKTDRRELLRWIWAGIGVAVAVSLGFGALLTYGPQGLTFQAQELIGGSLSIIAVGFVTWMVFWMAGAAKNLGAQLRGKIDRAADVDAGHRPWSLVIIAMLAVGREGLETALFLWAATRAGAGSAGATSTWEPLLGAALGLATAVLIGWLLYRGAVRINLTKFFTWTGGFLVVVAAGVLAYGVHDLQEARFLPGLENKAFDISDTLAPDSWLATLLKGIFNFQPAPTWGQVVVWFAYLVPVMTLFLISARRRAHPPAAGAAPPSLAPQPTTLASP